MKVTQIKYMDGNFMTLYNKYFNNINFIFTLRFEFYIKKHTLSPLGSIN